MLDLLPGRVVPLSPRRPHRPMVAGVDGESTAPDDTVVTRLLPQRERRTVGAWCFVDHYGPDDVRDSAGMQVAPHPHTGLQTVSWLFEGDVRHRDTVGSDALLQPDVLGLMTAGRGIAHSERSPRRRAARLHGVQLWVALPDEARDVSPAFELHRELPVLTPTAGARVRVMFGELAGVRSPATTYSPIVGADLDLDPGVTVTLPLDPAFEHALVVASGGADVPGASPTGQGIAPGVLAYLGDGRADVTLAADGASGARVLLLGGQPFEERLVMWWNFIGRSQSDIELARKAWNDDDTSREVFGSVRADTGSRMLAPPMPGVALRPRGRTG